MGRHGRNMGLDAALGAGIGTAIGAAFHNIPVWLALSYTARLWSVGG